MLRLILRYEDICAKTESLIESLGRILKIDSFRVPNEVFRADIHNIGGSPARFERQIPGIQQDRCWESEMCKEDKRKFERTAGCLNRTLGYKYWGNGIIGRKSDL